MAVGLGSLGMLIAVLASGLAILTLGSFAGIQIFSAAVGAIFNGVYFWVLMAFIGLAAIASISGGGGSSSSGTSTSRNNNNNNNSGSDGGFWNNVGDFLGGFNEGFNPDPDPPDPDDESAPEVNVSHSGSPDPGDQLEIEVDLIDDGNDSLTDFYVKYNDGNDNDYREDPPKSQGAYDYYFPVASGNNGYEAVAENSVGRDVDSGNYNPRTGPSGPDPVVNNLTFSPTPEEGHEYDDIDVGLRCSVGGSASLSGVEVDIRTRMHGPNNHSNSVIESPSGSSQTYTYNLGAFFGANETFQENDQIHIKIIVRANNGKEDDHYRTINIKPATSLSSMPSSREEFAKLRDEANYEENEVHDAMENIAKIHENHRYQSELEEKILDDGEDIIEDLERLAEDLNRLSNGNTPDRSPSDIRDNLKPDLNDLHADVQRLKEHVNEEMSNEKTVEELMPHLEEVFEALSNEEERLEQHVTKVMELSRSGSSTSHS